MKIFIIFILQFSTLPRTPIRSSQLANGHMYTFFNGNKDIMMVKVETAAGVFQLKKSEM